ncbi:MAG: hypothetical protein Kow0077_25970 [Anaerolineae bacterium]
MMRRIVILTVALALALPLAAWGPEVRPAVADTGQQWQGEYYTNTFLGGLPYLVRLDDAISFDWGTGSPAPGLIPVDNFSVRWSGPQQFAGGTYTFYATVDDGIRVWVNEQLIIDAWYDQIQTTHTGTITLAPGTYWVRVEYYDSGDQASVFLSWRPADAQTAPGGWAAEYYNNIDLTPPQSGGRLERTIDYNWGASSPIPGVINADNFSARWWGFPELEGGRYRFVAGADDGVRVYVDGQLVIDAWVVSAYQEHTGVIDLAPGVHTVKVEYFDAGAMARINVYWVREGPGAVAGLRPVTATVTASVLNVRSGPGVANPVVTQIRNGESYSVIGRNEVGSWVQIIGDGFSGWVSAAYVNLSGELVALPVTTAGEGVAPGGLLYAQSNASLRIRRAPTTQSPRIDALNRGERALVIGRTADNSWLQIRKDSGLEGWVSGNYVTLVGDLPLTLVPITG